MAIESLVEQTVIRPGDTWVGNLETGTQVVEPGLTIRIEEDPNPRLVTLVLPDGTRYPAPKTQLESERRLGIIHLLEKLEPNSKLP